MGILPKIRCGLFHCHCKCTTCELARARNLSDKAHCKKHGADCHAGCF